MENSTMGRVSVVARVVNLSDEILRNAGHLADHEVRFVEVGDALIDTGATGLSMPGSMIQKLGLRLHKTVRARTAGGVRDFRIYTAVRVFVQGRDCVIDVAELPEDCPVLIGQVPLESMDWVVDMKNQRLIGNPDHGGDWSMDMF